MSRTFWICTAVFFIVVDTALVPAGVWGSWFYALLCASWGVVIGLTLSEEEES